VSVEFVARDVPAFGWRRFRLAPSSPHPHRQDEGTDIAVDDIRVSAAADGTFLIGWEGRSYAGLCGIEDLGDRGDTYDFDPVPGECCSLESVRILRRGHDAGMQSLRVSRTFSVPAALAADRESRGAATVPLTVETEARLIRGVSRVDLRVRVDNRARDHRLRMLFPTGAPVGEFDAATTFDIARRRTALPDAAGWVHPAPATFPQQGFVRANGLTVAAPGLIEAEVTPAGVIAVTLLRAVGWLARVDVRTRPQPAGPSLETPGAQCLGELEAHLALFSNGDARSVRDAELGLWPVVAGALPLIEPGRALLEVTPRDLLLSALKPAESGEGIVLRLLNPTDAPIDGRIRFGFAVRSVTVLRLDETPEATAIALNGPVATLRVPPHALRTLHLTI
jgi:mannosylglycerate hydrolase